MTTPAHDLARSRLFLMVEDVDLIIGLVKTLPSRPVIADIGAGSGTTALAVLASNAKAHIYTIDISQENIDWAEKAIDAYYTPYWFGICRDSVEAAELFNQDEFDMIMLDTSHEYEVTRKEILAWLPRLKDNGVFWLHDYIGSDVKQAVDEAVESGLLELIEQHGLGWAGRKL